MTLRRPELACTLIVPSFAVLLLTAFCSPAQAQHTPDPYNIVGEYNSQFEPYMYANYPDAEAGMANQDRLSGRSGVRNSNNFQSYLDSDAGDLEPSRGGSRLSGPGTPYYRAYRQYDKDYGRSYRPNDKADKSYYENQTSRNDKYFQAIRETDPQARAKLLREFNLENIRNARTLSGGRKQVERDRFSTGEDEEPDREEIEHKLNTPAAPTGIAGRRAAASTAAPKATAIRGRNAPPLAPLTGRSSTRSAPSAIFGSAPRSTAPRIPGIGTGGSASDAIERSELMERASRSGSSLFPRSPAATTTP